MKTPANKKDYKINLMNKNKTFTLWITLIRIINVPMVITSLIGFCFVSFSIISNFVATKHINIIDLAGLAILDIVFLLFIGMPVFMWSKWIIQVERKDNNLIFTSIHWRKIKNIKKTIVLKNIKILHMRFILLKCMKNDQSFNLFIYGPNQNVLYALQLIN